MLFLAASALEKAAQVPAAFWLKLGGFVVAFILIVVFLRWLAGVNKVILAAVVLVGGGIIGFQWIYERNEPEFLTPIIDPIAQFFPSKGSYENTQQSEPDQAKKKKKSTQPAR